jgi:transient receptor potential cation channel subfamily M protein 3
MKNLLESDHSETWIVSNIQKRECVKFVPSPEDRGTCCCGLNFSSHSGDLDVTSYKVLENQQWMPSTHTETSPTDAYGIIEFQSEPRRSFAQYVRLAYDTRPELIIQLLTREWNLELPKLVITIQGGKIESILQSKLQNVLNKGLLKAAKITDAWIFTGGTNKAVAKRDDDSALAPEHSQYSGRMTTIGIAPWGMIEKNHQLLRRDCDVPYNSMPSPISKYAVLNRHHAHFLLADDGTLGKHGSELILRRELEKYIVTQKLHPGAQHGIPMVCLMIGGDSDSIRTVLEYVMATPPIPVVVCAGSGHAADLLAYTLNCKEGCSISTIQDTFQVGTEEANCIYSELLQCIEKKNLFITFHITDQPEETSQKLDQTIIKAVLRSQHLSQSELLSIIIRWNQVDIARSDIFTSEREWPAWALEDAMMQALKLDHVDFVKLLMVNGISMRRFLSIPLLEELYNTTQGPSNILDYILKGIRRNITERYTLLDIGLAINRLMGGAYRSRYSRRRFGLIYNKVMKKSHFRRNRPLFNRSSGNSYVPLNSQPETREISTGNAPFDYPFNELFIWAVLTKRQKMALLMLQYGAEALVKALIACKLYRAMACEAAADDLETHIHEDLSNYGIQFENMAMELLEFYYHKDHEQAQQLLTCELQNWSGVTCLNLAVAANHKALLAHPCSQAILGHIWLGGLSNRKNMNLKVIFGLLCPPYISNLEFKTKDELRHVLQTEEERFINLAKENENTDRRPSNIHFNVEPDTEVPVPYYNGRSNVVVQKNGEALTDYNINQDFDWSFNYFVVMKNRPLSWRRKLYEFYAAPITKFWADCIAYCIFLTGFTYVILVKMEITPSWKGIYVITYICTFACEKIREIVSSEPVSLRQKLLMWTRSMWNPCDLAAALLFFIGLCLRFSYSIRVGRLYFSVTSIYWHIRILKLMSVNKYLGPIVTIIGKMLQCMSNFTVILHLVVVSFGICRHAIIQQESGLGSSLILGIFMQPYLIMFGEMGSIDARCTDEPGFEECPKNAWLVTLVMGIFVLVSNVLLVNLLIANFNNIFNSVKAISHQVWMFQRFTFVNEYKQKPVLPPPLIVLCHIYRLLKYCWHKINGTRELRHNVDELFLRHSSSERLHYFEEECIEGYFQEQEAKMNLPSDDRIRNIAERIADICQEVEDVRKKEDEQTSAIREAKARIRELEHLANQTVSNLAW